MLRTLISAYVSAIETLESTLVNETNQASETRLLSILSEFKNFLTHMVWSNSLLWSRVLCTVANPACKNTSN